MSSDGCPPSSHDGYAAAMRTFHLILLVIAAVCFAIAFFAPGISTDATSQPNLVVRRWNLVAAGLLAWVIVPLSEIIDDMANDD